MPNSSLRRMMMAQKHSAPSEDWDIDWKYTDGPLENFGWTKFENGGFSVLAPDGLHLNGLSSGNYVRYACPIATCKKGICELEFMVLKYADEKRNEGFRPILSNGSYGCQIYTNLRGLVYNSGNILAESGPVISPIELNAPYTLRLEFDEAEKNRIFLNGELKLETPTFSAAYTSGNRIFQQGGGETVLKALRYKFIER